MISILNQIAKRAKKLLLLLIIIPLVTGAVSYYLESKKPTTYTATASFNIGNFNNEWLADPAEIEFELKKDKNLKKIKTLTNGEFNFADVKSRLVVTSPAPTAKRSLKFQYTGIDKKEVESTLHVISLGYEMIRNEQYLEKIKNQEESLAILDTIEQDDPEYAQVYFDLNNINYQETELLETGDAVATYNNPLKRALFGIILGIMLNVVILVTPELFREYR
ncbi:hypothetical protein MLOOGBEN_02055 [Bacillus sp. EB106-08-02-XG196]|jgi:teichuronic acid biosynthesis protein TuaF|uniref:hypothetical protein n=1 Tax=Bacillus sp. EB106-08-02-XG196 TaxID=2737049 RepID=UPI0015C494B1|nr:hypothetical protein [Bacillus sp. EB106-08-02-XG196]NWQ39479.1 hypothetical protein [Bacillus sp. EB106-08-02-XG196]